MSSHNWYIHLFAVSWHLDPFKVCCNVCQDRTRVTLSHDMVSSGDDSTPWTFCEASSFWLSGLSVSSCCPARISWSSRGPTIHKCSFTFTQRLERTRRIYLGLFPCTVSFLGSCPQIPATQQPPNLLPLGSASLPWVHTGPLSRKLGRSRYNLCASLLSLRRGLPFLLSESWKWLRPHFVVT